LITHDEEDVASLADAVICIDNGYAGDEMEPTALIL